MKINYKNASFPKPIISDSTDDYKKKHFKLNVINQNYNKEDQTLELSLNIETDNSIVSRIENEDAVVILHVEQITQREVFKINYGEENVITLDLMNYSTFEPIELLSVIVCKNDFKVEKDELNEIYSVMNTDISYSKGDIIGYSNDVLINLPEDKRIGSIFNLSPDESNILKGDPFKVILDPNCNLIEIIMNKELHNKFVTIYKKDKFVKKMLFFTIVEPALLTAYTEMFKDYDLYISTKWCKTLSSKIETKYKQSGSELFTPDNYEVDKVYNYTNIALGTLFKDAIEYYEKVSDLDE